MSTAIDLVGQMAPMRVGSIVTLIAGSPAMTTSQSSVPARDRMRLNCDVKAAAHIAQSENIK
ncbi:MAG: hypothetical protein WAV38_28435 [Xanthobacteraceae bacterium]